MPPKISIIIPCYNDGKYLWEAINSVEAHSDQGLYEIIVVNDGSKEEVTLRVLQEVEDLGIKVVHQANAGPAAARNVGIEIARSKYILLLDSDNKIVPAYLNKGIELLDRNEKLGVVYGNPTFFGQELKTWQIKDSNLADLLLENYIDNCAVIRKTAWESVGGLDERREIMGWEDWDLWMRLALKGWQFHHINEAMFYYRMRSDSLIHSFSKEEMKQKLLALFDKPEYELVRLYRAKVHELNRHRNDLGFIAKSFFLALKGKIQRRVFGKFRK